MYVYPFPEGSGKCLAGLSASLTVVPILRSSEPHYLDFLSLLSVGNVRWCVDMGSESEKELLRPCRHVCSVHLR